MTRLPPRAGEWIDRARPLDFEFEGQRQQGFAGDTIASALLASGVRVLGRSFKYHRPRGVLSAANHDVNAILQDDIALNLRADVTPLTGATRFRAVNTSGGIERDRSSVLDRLSAFLPVGFYYKTFHRPKWMFPHWERLIRSMSGLGALNFSAPRIRTPKRYDFCDVLVIGAGPAGLAAALAAANGGARVLLVDENARIGGSLTFALGGSDAASAELARLAKAVAASPNIAVRVATHAAGYYADHWVALVDAEKMIKVRARSVIVASGVFEQPAVFRNNDLPGVMLASAAQRLIHRYAVKPMQRAVVLAANAEGYEAALDLLEAGIEIAAIVDLRAEAEQSPAATAVRARGVQVRQGSCIYEAVAGSATNGVAGVRIARLQNDEPDLSSLESIGCDGVVMSVGFASANTLLHQAGARMRFDDGLQQFVPGALPAGVFAAGRVNGIYALDAKLDDGTRAAHEALRCLNKSAPTVTVRAETRRPSHAYPIVAHAKGKNFVDFDEDLHLADFSNAAAEGFDSVELIKRYTTVGMGPSQGKHSNMNAARILARIKGCSVADVGMTTARPFFHPVPLSHLAGRGFTPERVTPLHTRHARLNAQFMPSGVWQRPEYYRRTDAAKNTLVLEEVHAVRNAVGIIDVGTLGKIEVSGPDAGELLERVYTGRFKNLKVGMTRYAVMLDESGVVIDDGVVARLADERFYFTTTTTGSAIVYRELQRWIALWRLSCGVVNLTGAMAAINLAGPRSRELLQPLTGIALDEPSFPYLGVREGEVAGAFVRMMRVGFVGELGYEIHVPADRAAHLWDTLMKAGSAFGVRAFGVEAQRLLRLEKGHIIIGQDTDGLTTPRDAGLEWAVKMDKPFFVGQRSLAVIARQPQQQRLVGFSMPAREAAPKECHLIIRDGKIAGRVTSVAYSSSLDRTIGLAFVAPDLAAHGTKLEVRIDGGAMVQAEVVPLPFYDAAGARQKLSVVVAEESVPA